MKFKIKRKVPVTHLEHHAQAQPPYWASSYSPNSKAKMVASKHIRCTTPMTFSQKLYHYVPEVEEFEEALEANFWDLKNFLERCL